jgi:DNA-directed RNA polymerase
MLTIHDCYAALAPDAAQLNVILRDEFVKMYTEHDPLADLIARARRDGIKPPRPPKKGDLDLSDIRNSFFFFC